MPFFDAHQFAQEEYGRACLGHVSRLKRLVRIGAQLAQNPAASIPTVFQNKHQSKGLYRFASSSQVSHGKIATAHFRATAERSRSLKKVLVIQDTMHLSFGGRKSSDLGPVDTTGDSRGFLAHSALAVDASTRRPLGLLGQQVWVRSPKKRPEGETCEERKKRPRESEKWSSVSRQVEQQLHSLGSEKPRVVAVFDAEGDAFEAMETLDELGHGFIIRASKNRLLEDEEDDHVYLVEAATAAPHRGSLTVEIRRRPDRASRQARLELRATTIEIRPPKNRGRKGDSLEVSVVLATETNVPTGEEPVCWLLLTREPCRTSAEAADVVRDYALRWLIEEFHMGLKTGCSIEDRQLQTFDALANLLAICNPIAVGLLLLRHVARTDREAPAEHVLNPFQLTALRRLRPKLPTLLSAYAALRSIAELGGFLGRRSDGEPGWRTLWLGFRDILLAERVLRADQGSG